MIRYLDGDLLGDRVEALVNTVNTVGVSGKGIALQFKMRFPQNSKTYSAAAKRDQVQLGKMLPVWVGALDGPQWIINFPTKGHWRAKSRLSDIDAGLEDLVRVVRELKIQSIAVPPLGCGNGGLEWRDVRSLIEEKLSVLEDVDIHLFNPDGAPAPGDMAVETLKPRMTIGRATLLAALDEYLSHGEGATKLVIQKLAYLLQAAGVPLKLDFVKAKYGPYAETVNFVLQNMEGHYTRGYGDRTTPSPLQLMAGAVEEASSYLSERPELRSAVDRVSEVIDGLESPYGLELLSTVHYVASVEENRASNVDEAIAAVRAWSSRKDRLFTDRHIALAWNRLESLGWLQVRPNLNDRDQNDPLGESFTPQGNRSF